MKVGKLKVTLSAEKRSWVDPTMAVLAPACAIACLLSARLANAIGDVAAGFIAKHGFVYSADLSAD